MKSHCTILPKTEFGRSHTTDNPLNPRIPLTHLKSRAKRIQQEAGSIIPKAKHHFKKEDLRKPEIEIVYMDRKKLYTKLKKMHNRIQVGKYRMLIEVQKNAEDKMARRQKKYSDEIQEKDYKQIYDQFVKDQNSGELLKISNQILSLYEMYDEEEAQRKTKAKNFRLTVTRNHSNGLRSQSFSQKKTTEEDDLDSSADIYLLDSTRLRDYYDKVYSKTAAKTDEGIKHIIVNPEQIIKDRFSEKYFWSRMKKHGEEIKRNQTIQYKQGMSNPTTARSNHKKTQLSKNCIKILNEQNKLLDNASKRGLSEENREKLVQKFDETIYGMKRTQPLTVRKKNNLFSACDQETG